MGWSVWFVTVTVASMVDPAGIVAADSATSKTTSETSDPGGAAVVLGAEAVVRGGSVCCSAGVAQAVAATTIQIATTITLAAVRPRTGGA
jgi:hypothetical protein